VQVNPLKPTLTPFSDLKPNNSTNAISDAEYKQPEISKQLPFGGQATPASEPRDSSASIYPEEAKAPENKLQQTMFDMQNVFHPVSNGSQAS